MHNPFDSVAGDSVVKRDKWGRYLMPHPDTKQQQAWTRATTFAKSISDTFALNQWETRMVAKGIAMRPDLRSLAAATAFSDRNTLNKIAEDAKAAAGSKSSANLGTAMHAITEAADRGETPEHLSPEERRDLDAYLYGVRKAGIAVLPEYIERTCVWPKYSVAGIFDRIVRMPNGELRIGDVKTGANLSYGWCEIAIQLGIYASASHYYDWATGVHHEMPEVSRTLGVVFHLPIGQGTCTVYEVDLVAGIKAAELCEQVRVWRKMGSGLAEPLSSYVLEERTDLDRVRAATSKSALAELWNELHPQGRWTSELDQAARAHSFA